MPKTARVDQLDQRTKRNARYGNQCADYEDQNRDGKKRLGGLFFSAQQIDNTQKNADIGREDRHDIDPWFQSGFGIIGCFPCINRQRNMTLFAGFGVAGVDSFAFRADFIVGRQFFKQGIAFLTAGIPVAVELAAVWACTHG